ncbi:MAG: hypothetical protein R3284_11130 [Rubricoccaceae bacterium]|nr:hypothetical protein [Rubricoccaceae bacterium]
MILTRLRNALRRQDWFAVVLEMLIVIVGVVVGFQVTAWGNQRSERAEEQELLRGLQSEFTQVMLDLETQVGKHQRIERALASTLEALTEAERTGGSTAVVADTTIAWANIATTTQFSQGLLDGLLTTGRLGLIQDQELQSALSEWEGVLADVTEDEIASRHLVTDQFAPILWRRMDVRSFLRYGLVSGTLPPSELGSVSEIPVDNETLGVLATRLYWQQHLILEFEGPQEEAHRILGLIEQSLE